MQIISFVSQKGGSGKSTVATNCAVVAAQAGERVMVLDVDPQQSSYNWGVKRRAKWPDKEFPQVKGIAPEDLKPAVKAARQMDFDWVLIDTPGHHSPGVEEAIKLSDMCVIPCRTTPKDIEAIIPTVREVLAQKKPTVLALTQVSAISEKRIDEARNALKGAMEISPFHIAYRVIYQDVDTLGLGVTEFEPEGKAAEEMREFWKWLGKTVRRMSNATKA